MRIALFEFLCSSGAYRDSGPQGPYAPLLDEGAAMLLSLASDLVQCNHHVAIGLELSIYQAWKKQSSKRSTLEQLDVHPIDANCDPDHEPDIQSIAHNWTQIASGCDRAIVIAPELDGLLLGIVQEMRARGCQVLAADDRFLAIASDKWETYQHWALQNQAVVPTALAGDWLADPDRIDSDRATSDGWVLKRRCTAGGTQMQRFSSKESLVDQLKELQLSQSPQLDSWVVQPWILGLPASLAILGQAADPIDQDAGIAQPQRVIGPSEQLFDASSGCYVGGRGPLACDPDRLCRFAKNLLDAIPGEVRGWVGIDFMVQSDGRWRPLEINARLTSSYLGYRQIYGPGLADSILGSPIPCLTDTSGSNPRLFRFSVTDFHG